MEKYRINIKYMNIKLCIDELPFGIYLEIEGTRNKIEMVSNELGFNSKDRILETYWEIFDNFKNINGLQSLVNIEFDFNHKSKIMQLVNRKINHDGLY